MTLVSDLWKSFRGLPTWVQIWMVLILVPVNAASIRFLAEPSAGVIALLAIGGMVPNIFIMIGDRRFTNRMAVPHVILWIPLVVFIGYLLFVSDADLSSTYATYLKALLIVNLISLSFDIPETMEWYRTRHRPS